MTIENEIVLDEFTLELQKDFLSEALFLLEACEESYLKLENPDCREEELAQIFRAAHSFKGTGASVGLFDMAALAHIAEDCLSVLRVNPNLVNSDVISLLLEVGDAFKARVHQLQAGSKDPWKVESLKERLSRMTEALKIGTVPNSSASHEDPAQEAKVASASPATKELQQTEDSPVEVETTQKGPQTSSTIKVDSGRLDAVLDLIGELVVTKSQLAQSYRSMNQRNSHHESVMALLDKSVRELQDRAMSMRMTSLKPLFLKIQRAVRDVALKLGKDIDFVMSGEEVEIDRTMIELLGDPLVHIARNAVDHGIEKPEIRKNSGKPTKAKVLLSAQQSGGRILIEVKDDGGGINKDYILKKGMDRGLIPAGKDPKTLPDSEIYGLLFAPGFSTAEIISDISGRGVGLDVVRSNIEKLKGTVEVESQLGSGSTFRISIPLSAAITDGMLVATAGDRYIVPLSYVRELIRINPEDVTQLTPKDRVISVRGRVLPLIETSRILKGRGYEASPPSTRALVVETSQGLTALAMEEVLGQIQVVVKPLPEKTTLEDAVSGSAILGDGRVALVLNIDTITSP